MRGYLHALNWVVLVGFFNAFFALFPALDIHPIIVICQSMIIAGIALLALAGPGRLSSETIKSPHTWYYGICYMGATALFIAALNYISATQMSLLIKAVVPISFLISALFFKRHMDLTGWVGFWLVIIGLAVVSLEIPKEHFGIVIFIVIVFALFETFQMLVSDIHSTSNKAIGSVKESMRVTGLVLAVTAVMFIILCIFGAIGVEYAGLEHGLLPSFQDILNPWSFGLALIYGLLGLSFTRYSEFVSTREIKFEIFLALTSLSVITTLVFEWSLSALGYIEMKEISLIEICGGGIIIIGSINAVYARALAKKRQEMEQRFEEAVK